MSWTTPRTWTPGELVTALMMNQHVRDNLNELRAGFLTNVIIGTNPAQSGAIRLANAERIASRNSTNSTDLDLIFLNSVNQIEIGESGVDIIAGTGARVFINDSENGSLTQGLTINQGANDDEILALKSSDTAHGVTSQTETDTYCFIKKHASTGGVVLAGMGGGAGSTVGLNFRSVIHQNNATRGTTAVAPLYFNAASNSGTGIASVGADKNIACFADNDTVRHILDSDGDSHQDVGTAWTNFDSHDDVLALNALALHVSRNDDPYKDAIRQHFGASLASMIPREELSRMKLVTFNEDGHHFVNMSKLTMLHTGAIRQMSRRVNEIEVSLFARLADVTRRLEMLNA